MPDLARRCTPRPVGESMSLLVVGVASGPTEGAACADGEGGCCVAAAAGAGVVCVSLGDGDANRSAAVVS